MDITVDNVFPDGPSSNPTNPSKALIRSYFRQFETAVDAGLSNGGLIYDTKASMDADLAHDANASAWVIADDTVANNGIYRKSGASGSGSWTRIADLPYSFISASNAGAGTANAIEATTSVPIPAGDLAAKINVNITANNTGPATVAFNGGAALPIKTNSGADVQADYLVAGGYIEGFIVGGAFRLTTDVGTAADRAAAEAAVAEVKTIFLGSFESAHEPTTDLEGGPLKTGAQYFNTDDDETKVWNGTEWLGQGTVVDGSVTDAKVATPATPADGVDSGKLKFLQLGTSAVARSVQEKLRDIIDLRDFGVKGDGVNDDTASVLNAVAQMKTNGGGRLILPKGRFMVGADILLDFNSFDLVGSMDGASIIDFGGTASKLDVATVFDVTVGGLSVLNAAGDAVVFGETAGPQTYLASFRVFDIATKFAGGRGISFGGCYMGNISGLRSQNSTGIGIDMSSGLKTSLEVENSHALDGDSDGWKIKNGCYMTFSTLGADRNGGYAYDLENLFGVGWHGGAEDNDKAMFHFHYDAASPDVIKGFAGVTIRAFEKENNALGDSAMGSLAHFTASAGSSRAGEIIFDGCVNFSDPPGNALQFDSGNYRVALPRSRNRIKRAVGGGSFSVIADGATDAPDGLAVNITGANTPVANLRPKLCNGVTSYGGRLTVYVAKNNLGSASRSATYELLVTRATGVSDIKVIESGGNSDGATSDSAGFTFTLDATNNRLLASPAGSTGTGNWFFHISATGNIDVEPL